VIAALEWLRLNYADYADIQILPKNAMQYAEGMPPVSVEYKESSTNKVSEGTSVFDREKEDGTVEGDCAFTVHGLTGKNFNTMTLSVLKVVALRHLNSGGNMLAIGHSDKFELMWNNPQLYFPGFSHMVSMTLAPHQFLIKSISGISLCIMTNIFRSTSNFHLLPSVMSRSEQVQCKVIC
jgi:hypothetical protein